MMYRSLAEHLAADQPLYGLQSRALHDGQQEHDTVEVLAVDYAQAILQHQPTGPYHLLGWSSGGILALATAQALEEQGCTVALVGLIDTDLAAHGALAPAPDPLQGLAVVLGPRLVSAFQALDVAAQQALRSSLATLGPRQRLEYALAWGQQRGLPGAGVSADVLHRHAELAERHVALLQRYHVPTVRAPLYVWLADDHAREGPLPVSWGRYSLGAVGVEGVPGDHYSMLRPPHVAILAARIRRVLDLESARGPRREPHAARCVGARGVASE